MRLEPLNVSIDGDRATVRLLSELTSSGAARLYETALRLSRRGDVAEVRFDFAAVETIDSAGSVSARVGCQLLEAAGKRCVYAHLNEGHRAAFAMVPQPRPPQEASKAGENLAEIADRGVRAGNTLLLLGELVVDTVRGIPRGFVSARAKRGIGAVIEQGVTMGVNAVLLVALLSFLIGLILAFQSIYQLRQFGAESFMANILSLGMVREFAPLMTAIILTGRSGAAIAAELGTMAVRDEIDALHVLGVSPTGFLVMPRVVAITIVQPVLTLLSMLVGLCAGLITARLLGLSPYAMYYKMVDALNIADFELGFTKSVLFAWVIGFTGCVMGLRTRGGAHSVGHNTTRAVVSSIFSIIVIDSIVTTTWTVGHV